MIASSKQRKIAKMQQRDNAT